MSQQQNKVNSSDDLIQVGWVKSAHGLNGELYIKLVTKVKTGTLPEWVSEVDEYVFKKENTSQAYKFKKTKPHKEGFIAIVEGVSNRNQSEALRGNGIYINKSILSSGPGDSIYLIEVLDFEVFDKENKPLGQIKSFLASGPQDIIVIKNDDGEFDVPWVEAFIVSIDFDNKKVVMDLPEGLLSEI